MRSLTRIGFSLLEVVLALAIFFASAAALGQLLLVGVRTARWTEHASEAALRCESKLAEIVAGLEPARSEPPTPFDDDEHWEFEVEVVPTGVPALLRVMVTVRHFTNGNSDAEVGLARLLADPTELEPPAGASFLTPTPPTPLSIEEMLGVQGGSP